jgi:opacity protein-like surface antigen
LFFLASNLKAQELYIFSGKNSTRFIFKSTNDTSENIAFRKGLGSNLEIGYTYKLKNNLFVYALGLSYNEFEAEASNYATNYTWETTYIGIINKISYNLSGTKPYCYFGVDMSLFLNTGFNTATLINGSQFINNYYYDLSKNEEFSGVLLQPFIGISAQYIVSRNFKLNLGYNFSKTFNLTNKTAEKTSFNTNQFQIGLQVSLSR